MARKVITLLKISLSGISNKSSSEFNRLETLFLCFSWKATVAINADSSIYSFKFVKGARKLDPAVAPSRKPKERQLKPAIKKKERLIRPIHFITSTKFFVDPAIISNGAPKNLQNLSNRKKKAKSLSSNLHQESKVTTSISLKYLNFSTLSNPLKLRQPALLFILLIWF